MLLVLLTSIKGEAISICVRFRSLKNGPMSYNSICGRKGRHFQARDEKISRQNVHIFNDHRAFVISGHNRRRDPWLGSHDAYLHPQQLSWSQQYINLQGAEWFTRSDLPSSSPYHPLPLQKLCEVASMALLILSISREYDVVKCVDWLHQLPQLCLGNCLFNFQPLEPQPNRTAFYSISLITVIRLKILKEERARSIINSRWI